VFDEEAELVSFFSEEGSRQGCSAGTEALCLTLHRIVAKMQQLYPDYQFRVITDDIVPIVPPPESNTAESWQATYQRYALFLHDLQTVSLELAGLHLNADKGALLLPAGAPPPSHESLALFEAAFQFKCDGFRIAGAPVGSAAFMNLFMAEKVYEAVGKLKQIQELGKQSPRAAHRLLTACGTKLLVFLAATVPPDVAFQHLQAFDAEAQGVYLRVIGATDADCAPSRMARALLKACLRPPFGCGLTKIADQACIAWWASTAMCLQDPLLFQFRMGLQQHAQPAHDRLTNMLGGTASKYWTRIMHLFPHAGAGLLDGSLYAPRYGNECQNE
jgi:hypothetical protein